jgi:toxin-antitoxin system PIN domain toxin
MILIDTNLLLYAYDTSNPMHEPARQWQEETLSSGRAARFALVTLLAFVRIIADRRVFDRPLSVEEACAVVQSLLAVRSVRVIEPGEQHWQVLAGVASAGQASGPMVMDAHLAALALEHGAAVATTDRDFSRFEGLSFHNPLQVASEKR